MSAFLAIVMDTWRQSIKQVVFMIMLVLMLIIVLAAIILPKRVTTSSGEPSVGYLWSSEPDDLLAQKWLFVYANSLRENAGVKVSMKELQAAAGASDDSALAEYNAMKPFLAEARKAAKATPLIDRQSQTLVYFVGTFLYSIAMMLFIAACAGYFPDTLSAGAVDILVSKPISRAKLFFGKYLGGLILVSIALFTAFGAIYLGIGIRLGSWQGGLFKMLPLTIFSAALLYAILAFVGIAWRSTSLGIVLGYLFYIIVDTALGALMGFQETGAFDKWTWLSESVRALRLGMPNFELLKELATVSSFNVPHMNWQPLVTAVAWLFGTLGLGYWVFRRRDF